MVVQLQVQVQVQVQTLSIILKWFWCRAANVGSSQENYTGCFISCGHYFRRRFLHYVPISIVPIVNGNWAKGMQLMARYYKLCDLEKPMGDIYEFQAYLRIFPCYLQSSGKVSCGKVWDFQKPASSQVSVNWGQFLSCS